MAFFPRALSLSLTISRTGTLTLLCLAPTSLNCVFYRENNLGVAVHGNRLPTRRANAKVERVVPWRAVALAEAAQRALTRLLRSAAGYLRLRRTIWHRLRRSRST